MGNQYSGEIVKLGSAINLLDQFIQEYKIPEVDLAKSVLPPESATRIEVFKTQIILAPGTVEVEVDDLKAWINPSTGLFEINGIWGAAYIHTIRTASYDVEDLPKWHVTMCSYLQKRLQEGSLYDRYALKDSTILEDQFSMTLSSTDSRPVKRKLRACILCMKVLNSSHVGIYRDAYRYKFTEYVNEFNQKPNHREINNNNFRSDLRSNAYNEDFQKKATQYKKGKIHCSQCNGIFSSKFLEVHHVNRLKYDDRPENWKLLCVSCHIYEHRRDNPRMRLMYQANGRLQSFYNLHPKKQHSLLKD